MKILYAVQGTGNGHLSRAMDVIPCLQKRAEVDILVSGIQADLELPFEVKYRRHGLSFIFGKAGGVDLWKTFMSNKVRDIVKEVNEIPIDQYDLVINDFEPVTAWACYLKEHPCIGLSHQAAVLDIHSPKPEEVDMMGKFILKHYAPTDVSYGFHFQPYTKSIFTPVIRQQIRHQTITDNGHYTVYLPAYDDARLLKSLLRFGNVQWDVFSKHNKVPFTLKNVNVQPINNEKFISSMASAHAILCGAGFETPAEALYLKKKLMVIPMKNQYEQHLNAAALRQMGVPVIKNLKAKNNTLIDDWIGSDHIVSVDYPDCTQEIIDHVLDAHT
ncbi:glycosyl transferase [Olivibacter sp. SDN3]|uniref:glycosyltransferase family protein n=1 Tax=Olivibacter sp. SDN3 TaxID=2764720 RepID=UPI00165147A9|nr:glycosyltransferase family protein [Olivibacter sp. SDN3]QNL49472.1 glycosyl transferase [Olivibacter sp. SDN3]